MKKFFLLLVVCFTFGCSSTTLIKTDPPGAMLYVDNVRLGITPYSYEDPSTFFTTARPIVLKKEGYKNFDTTIRKTDISVGRAIGGCFCGFPWFWVTIYPKEYSFELEK